jgi:hypothetical protein
MPTRYDRVIVGLLGFIGFTQVVLIVLRAYGLFFGVYDAP